MYAGEKLIGRDDVTGPRKSEMSSLEHREMVEETESKGLEE